MLAPSGPAGKVGASCPSWKLADPSGGSLLRVWASFFSQIKLALRGGDRRCREYASPETVSSAARTHFSLPLEEYVGFGTRACSCSWRTTTVVGLEGDA